MKYTYATLVTAITDWTEDPSDELQSHIDEIISLGHTRLVKDLDLEIFKKTATGTFTAGNQFIAKPSDAVSIKTLTYVSGSRTYYVNQRTDEYLDEYWPNSAQRGAPKHYSEFNETSLRLVPTPVSTYAWKARYIVRPDDLTSSNTTTFLSTHAGEPLLYACLLEAEAFIKASPEDINIWVELYKSALIASSHEMMNMKNVEYKEPEVEQ